MQNHICYDRDHLQSWLDGNSDSSIDLHVRDCTACQRVLDDLCGNASVELSSAHGRALISYVDDPACQAMVQRAKAIERRPVLETHSAGTYSTPSLHSDSLPSKVGQEIGHYRIVRELGRGGMSIVYEANDLHMGRSVAIKFMRSAGIQDAKDIARLLREARAAASIQHANVVTVFDVQFDPQDGLPYLVMEYVPGPSLQSRISKGPTIPLRTAVAWIASIAEGLHAAHQLGVVHRDIKPSNILLAACDSSNASLLEAWTPKLADFGLAQTDQLDLQLTRTGFLTGTPAYASPEQARSERASKLSDIYSLGVTLFETLTKEIPFRGSTLAVLRQISENEFPSPRMLNPTVPVDVETICLKACNQEPLQRYDSAQEFAADLRRWLAGVPIQARPVSQWERLMRWIHRNQRVAGLLFIVLGLLTTLAMGGLIGSLWMAKAKRDLADQVIEANAAKDIAELATETATKQQAAAMAQRKVAVDSLNALVGQVQNRLSSRPGTLALRQELLQVALQGFEEVLKPQDPSDVDDTIINARIQLASIHSTLGKKQEAADAIQNAIMTAESAVQQQSHNATLVSELATALATQADFLMAEFAHEQAKPLYERAFGLFEQASNDGGLSLDKLKAQWQCRMKLAMIATREKRFDDAIRDLEPMRVALEAVWDSYPDHIELKRLRVTCLNLLSTAYASIQSSEMYRLRLEEAVRLIGLLRGMDPQHPTIASDAAILQGKLARLERETGNLDKAIEEASIAVDRVLEFAALDKSNLNAQSMVGNIYDVQYEAFLHSGRLEEAAQATRESFDAHASVLSQSPGSFRHIVFAGESAAKLGDAYLRNRQYSEALKWLERSSEILEQYRNLPDPLPAQAEGVAKGYAEYLKAVRFATDRSVATPVLEDPPVERLFALSMRAYVDALEGSNAESDKNLDTCSEWMQSMDDVSESAVVLVDRSQLMMIRALLVASLSQPNQDHLDPASYRSRALAMARKNVADKPGLIEAYLAEPDMAAIRDQLKNAP